MEELRRREEELENRIFGDVEVEFKSKEDIVEEKKIEEGEPTL